MTLIQWLESLWGVQYVAENTYIQTGQWNSGQLLTAANAPQFLEAASCITVVVLVAVAALLFAGILNLCGSHR